jgi:hypothetical protein
MNFPPLWRNRIVCNVIICQRLNVTCLFVNSNVKCLMMYSLYCANGIVGNGTSLLYKWQRKVSNRRSYQLLSIVTIWDVPLQTGVGNMNYNYDRMMSMWCIRMVQPLFSLSACIRSRVHLNVYLANLADF